MHFTLHDCRSWFYKHLWLLLFAITALISYGNLFIPRLQVVLRPGHGLLPPFPLDDPIYYQIAASSRLCVHNLTSTLTDGGCRLRPLWLLDHWADFGIPGFGMLFLRIVLFSAFAASVAAGARIWARRRHLNEVTARNWLAALLILTPLPLVDPELTLPASMLVSIPNLLSWLLYLLAAGGFYLYRDQPKTWPLSGVLAGFWALNHPYYLGFILTLWVVWLALSRPMKRRDWIFAGLLVAPTLAAAAYYLWLFRTNAFFRFHLATNLTRFGNERWWLILSVLTLAAAYCIATRHSTSTWKPDRFLVAWVAVAALWLLIPSATERRLILTLPLPLALLITGPLVTAHTARPKLLAAAILASNAVIITATLITLNLTYLTANRTVFVSDDDTRMAAQLRQAGPDKLYLADAPATQRFLWLSQTRILNAHHHESPDFALWHNTLFKAIHQHQCSPLTRLMSAHSITGVILSRSDAVSNLETCHLIPTLQTNSWVVLAPAQSPGK